MALVALVSISLVLFSFSINTTTLTQAQCLPDQRYALIQLNQGFNTSKINSWNASTDCCIWDGITCDEQTGMITEVNLAGKGLTGELNPALFNLSSLQYLNLANNNFINIPLPQIGFERLANLTHLDLCNSGFSGQVPIGISALTNLISLNLSSLILNIDPLYLHGTGLKTLLSNLTKLQVLRLDGVDISLDGSEWGKAVFQVGPTLQELSMTYCELGGNLPEEIFHLTNLIELDLSHNLMLSGQVPDSIGNLEYLLILGLMDCSFFGKIPPSITNLTRLASLDLSSNSFTGTIPVYLFSHPFLEKLDLSYNQLSGYLSEFSNGSSILESIKLDYNNLQGKLPISIFKSPQLSELTLESNNFNGKLDIDIIKHNKKLVSLHLSNNKLSITEGINHNKSFYASFPQMGDIHLASCNLTKFPSFLSYQKHIGILNLSNNSLTGDILLSMCNATLAQALDLSYNSLTGTIPPCLLEAEFRQVLNLRSNRLRGPLPQNISPGCKFVTINLNGNRINGSLPKSLMNCKDLEVLDVGNNQIVDTFPFWLGNLKILRVLVLGTNQFYGTISNMDAKTKTNNSFFPALQVLDLCINRFSGIIPKIFFENMKAMVDNSNYSTLDFGYDYQNSITAVWKGQEVEITKSLVFISIINLSQNRFSGEMPEEIGQLKSLDVLNLSHNVLTGPIPSRFADLYQLQSLDLSSNELSGHIPQELTSLTFLASLNLSYNNLAGGIPQANQFSTFSNTSYMGNPRLCGSPLSMHCAAAPSDQGLILNSSTDINVGLYVSIGVGLGVGFASVVCVLVSWENGRERFNFIVDKFYFLFF